MMSEVDAGSVDTCNEFMQVCKYLNRTCSVMDTIWNGGSALQPTQHETVTTATATALPKRTGGIAGVAGEGGEDDDGVLM
jgi:hypothetical protein